MIFIDRRAFNLMMINVEDDSDTETGGLLIGFHNKGDITIVDVVNCRDDSLKTYNSIELDEKLFYEANHRMRLYNGKADIVGIWHLHNTDSDDYCEGKRFSKDDINSHKMLLTLLKKSIVSILFVKSRKDMVILNVYKIDSIKTKIEEFDILNIEIEYTY